MDALSGQYSPLAEAARSRSPAKPPAEAEAAGVAPPSPPPFLPPSPPPAAPIKTDPSPPPTPAPHPPQHLDWPFNHPGLLCYFDPFSPKATALYELLERKAQKHNLHFPSTPLAANATHVVLDPRCELNTCFRTGQNGFVVSLDWAKDSFFMQERADEEAYKVQTLEEEGEMEVDEEEEKEEEESSQLSGKDYVAGVVSKNGWRKEEEEHLAQFLSNRPVKEKRDPSVFQKYAKENPRTATGYQEHYRLRKLFLERRAREIRSERGDVDEVETEDEDKAAQEALRRQVFGSDSDSVPESDEEKPHEESQPENSGNDSESEFDETSEDDVGGPSSKKKRGSLHRIPQSSNQASSYSSEERAYLIKLLSKLHLSLSAVINQFSKKFPDRTTSGAHQHYYYYRSYYDRQSGRGGDDGSEEDEEEESGSDEEDDESDSNVASTSAVRTPRSSSGYNRVRYTVEENDYLRRLLRKAGGSWSSEITDKFCKAYPKRNPIAVHLHYTRRKAQFDNGEEINPKKPRPSSSVKQEGEKASAAFEKEGKKPRWSVAEDQELAVLIAQTPGPKVNAFRKLHAKRPSRTVNGISDHYRKKLSLFEQLVKAVRQENGSTSNGRRDDGSDLDDDEPLTSTSTKSHHQRRVSEPQPGPSSSKRARYEEGPTSSSSKQHNVGASSSSSRPRHSFSSTSSSSQHHHNAVASGSNSHSHSRHKLPPSSSSSSGSDLEPDSFLAIGTRPQSCPLTALFCFFCGSYKHTTFSPLPLAAKRQECVRVADRTACAFCKAWYERRMVKGEKLGEGVKEMGELERLAWVTEKLVEKGLALRREDVFGE